MTMDQFMCLKNTLLLIASLFHLCICKEIAPTHIPEYEAVEGGSAHLPCNITYPEDRDDLTLLLWYRDQSRAPIYTTDFRRGGVQNARNFPSAPYAERAHFDALSVPPSLRLDLVSTEDSGVYRCSVEHRTARTLARTVKLNVLIPPQKVLIMDDRGQNLQGLAGPYDEGAYLSLICEAEGGKPTPTVTWWRERALLDDTFYRYSDGYVRNELVILELRRSDLMVEYSCRASNTELARPLNQTVRIDLNLRPLYARITTLQRPLRAGEELRLNCESSGSRPPAKVTWWLEGRRVQSGKESIPTSRNVTYSSLSLSPGVADNGKTVACRAENAALSQATVQDTWYLNVHFPPSVSLHLGANIKYSTIREGNDVYMECSIHANPPVTDLTWIFEDKVLYGDPSTGIIVSNQSLVLQKVKKHHRGRYRCIASNTEGEGHSADLLLEVKYAPSCKSDQKAMYGVARGEVVNVSCDVDADPSDVTFRWALNNSVENAPLNTFTSKGGRSVLSYTPQAMLEYGALLCWGSNTVGEQSKPCVARIIPAGPPDPVRNCLVVNQSHSWLLVECEAGYGGGLTQKFHLDVYNSAVDHLQVNLTAVEAPVFSVHRLPPATQFVLVVYASNEKGKSNSLAMVGNTLPNVEAKDESTLMATFSPLVAILLAVVGTLLMIGVIALAFIQLRKRRPHKTSIEEDKIKMDVILKKTVDDLIETTTACPDVVPPNNIYGTQYCDSLEEVRKEEDRAISSKEKYHNYVDSWNKGQQENTEVEAMLSDLGQPLTRLSESSTSLTDLLGGEIEDMNSPCRKLIITIEPPPESHNKKVGESYRTDAV